MITQGGYYTGAADGSVFNTGTALTCSLRVVVRVGLPGRLPHTHVTVGETRLMRRQRAGARPECHRAAVGAAAPEPARTLNTAHRHNSGTSIKLKQAVHRHKMRHL